MTISPTASTPTPPVQTPPKAKTPSSPVRQTPPVSKDSDGDHDGTVNLQA